MELDPNIVEIPDRLRDLNTKHVNGLAETITQSKWIAPITVLKKYSDDGDEIYQLVAGYHRLEACKKLSLSVPVSIIEDASQIELLEIVENYSRLELSASEKLEHQQKLTRIYNQRPGATYGGLVEETAESMGIGASTARRNISRAAKLSPSVLKEIKGTPLDTQKFIDTLAGMGDEDARLNRIKNEKTRLAKPTTKAVKKVDDSQAAGWIAGILRQGLSDAELTQIRGLLLVTTRKALDKAIEQELV